MKEHLKEIQNASFLVDFIWLDIPLKQQEIKNEPKPVKLLNLSLRKKKDKFSGRPGEKAERFKAAKNIKIAAASNVSVEKVEEMWELLDLPKEQILFSDTETDENKVLEQHPFKVLPHDELKLIKNNQMLTDTSVNLAQDILGTQFKMKGRLQDAILGQNLMFKSKEHFVETLCNKVFTGLHYPPSTASLVAWTIMIVYFRAELKIMSS